MNRMDFNEIRAKARATQNIYKTIRILYPWAEFREGYILRKSVIFILRQCWIEVGYC
jgi:hypothetical protein